MLGGKESASDEVNAALSPADKASTISQSAFAGVLLSVVAMLFAAAGLLPPVWGALTQEAIDVAVIVNALRARRDPSERTRLHGTDADLARRFANEHATLRPRLDELLALADVVGNRSDGSTDLTAARAALDLLRNEIEPHELAEGAELYPVVNLTLGGPDPTAVMARAHLEISRLIDRLEQLLACAAHDDQVTETDVNELRRLLYGLQAILALHNSQEEEGYLSLADPPSADERTVSATPT